MMDMVPPRKGREKQLAGYFWLPWLSFLIIFCGSLGQRLMLLCVDEHNIAEPASLEG